MSISNEPLLKKHFDEIFKEFSTYSATFVCNFCGGDSSCEIKIKGLVKETVYPVGCMYGGEANWKLEKINDIPMYKILNKELLIDINNS